MSDATTTTDDVRFATTWRPDFAVDVDVWRWGDAALATGQSPTSMVETVSLTLRDVRPKVATPLGGRLPAASPTQVVSLSARCQAPRRR
jgi:hypothetical protein